MEQKWSRKIPHNFMQERLRRRPALAARWFTPEFFASKSPVGDVDAGPRSRQPFHRLRENKPNRESVKQGTPYSMFDLWKLMWSSDHPLHYGIQLSEKLAAETVSLLFVPRDRIYDIEFRFVTSMQLSVH